MREAGIDNSTRRHNDTQGGYDDILDINDQYCRRRDICHG
jgi:hypothetical protein